MIRRFCNLPLVPAVLVTLATLTGCGGGAMRGARDAPSSAMASAMGAPAANMAPASPSPPPAAPQPANAPQQANAKTEKQTTKNAGPTTRAAVIIYQGELKMVADTSAIPKTIDAIIDLSESLGGHLVARKNDSVQIRVPSASFRNTMTKIEGLGTVVERSVTADDVSEEFHDLEVQLGNLRATRTRLQQFLDRAGGVADMLAVEHELERVSLEIDRIEGKLEFLRTRAAMSVISIGLTAKAAPIVNQPGAPRPVELPIAWTSELGVDSLLKLQK